MTLNMALLQNLKELVYFYAKIKFKFNLPMEFVMTVSGVVAVACFLDISSAFSSLVRPTL